MTRTAGHVAFGMPAHMRLCDVDDMTALAPGAYGELADGDLGAVTCNTCIVMLHAGVSGETSGRLTVHDAGGKAHDIPLRDLKTARGCRFAMCAQRMSPCSEHPRTEWMQ